MDFLGLNSSDFRLHKPFHLSFVPEISECCKIPSFGNVSRYKFKQIVAIWFWGFCSQISANQMTPLLAGQKNFPVPLAKHLPASWSKKLAQMFPRPTGKRHHVHHSGPAALTLDVLSSKHLLPRW